MQLSKLFLLSLPIFGFSQIVQPNYDAAALAAETQAMALGLAVQANGTILDPTSLRTKFLNWPSPATPFLTCNTANLTIDDSVIFKTPVSCNLSVQPKSTVTVFLEAYGMKFSTCYLQFNPANWQTPQLFYVISSLNLFATQKPETNPIYMLAFTETESYNNQTFILPVSRNSRAAVTCTLTGDPHIKTFDTVTNPTATNIDFYGNGTFTIIESTAGLRVLGTYSPCYMTGRTCISQLQVQYNQISYIFSYAQNADVTKTILTTSNFGTVTNGLQLVYSADTVN